MGLVTELEILPHTSLILDVLKKKKIRRIIVFHLNSTIKYQLCGILCNLG